MAVKPGAKICEIAEQIIEDEASGLTLLFRKRDDGGCSLSIFKLGEETLPFGNRDLGFDSKGEHSDAGTHLGECPRPSWIKEVAKD